MKEMNQAKYYAHKEMNRERDCWKHPETAVAPLAANKDFGSPSPVRRSAGHDHSPPAPPCRASNMPAPLRSWASVVAHSGDPGPSHSAAVPGEPVAAPGDSAAVLHLLQPLLAT
jgi:hypothetical protein